MNNDALKKNRPSPIVFNIWLAKETIKAYPELTQDYKKTKKQNKQKPNNNKQNKHFHIHTHTDNIPTGQLLKTKADILRQHFFI